MANSKSKKIIWILGIGLFLTLVLFQFAWAQDCSQYNGNLTLCKAAGCDYKEETGECLPSTSQPPPGGEKKPAEEEECACGWNLICWAGCILKGIMAIPLIIIVPVVIVFSMLMAFFGMILTEIAQTIAQVMIASSLTLSVTALGGGEIFKLWMAVRDIALWFFAVFLALIGLATIFRIESYWAKKALVPLLIVVLLFNFIPFIVRTIVSIGNSLSCWTLSKLGAVCGGKISLGCTGGEGAREVKLDFFQDETGNLAKTFTDLIGAYFHAAWAFLLSFGTRPGQFIADSTMLMTAAIIFAVFWFAFAIILLLFGLSFLVRMVFIWLLFLASPIAFATFALRTREIKAAFPGPLNWEGWIEQILEWSFVGVLMSFWIGIAACLITMNPLQAGFQNISLTKFDFGKEYQDYVTDAFKTSAKYIAAIVALYLGFKAAPGLIQGFVKGITTAAVAVGTIVATAGLSAGASLVGGAAKRLGGWVAQKSPTLARFGEGARRFAERMETYVPARAALEETLKGVPFAGPVMERMAAARKAEKEKLEAAEKKYKEWGDKGLFDKLKGEALSFWLPKEQRAKALEVLVEKKKIELAVDAFKGKTLDEIRKDYGSKVANALRTQRPDLLTYVVKDPTTRRTYTPDEIKAEIEKLTPREVAQINFDAFAPPTGVPGYVPGSVEEAIAEAILSDTQKIRVFERESMEKKKKLRERAGLLWGMLPDATTYRLTTHPAWQV